jgi:hypothetical protein
MDKDELQNQLFEHALQVHGFILGVLLRDRKLTSEKAVEQVEPFRQNLVRLYEAAGRPIPRYLERDE